MPLHNLTPTTYKDHGSKLSAQANKGLSSTVSVCGCEHTEKNKHASVKQA